MSVVHRFITLFYLICDFVAFKTEAVQINSTPCQPNRVYENQRATCVCTKDGEWPHDECYEHFPADEDNELQCDPDKLLITDCNVCRCGQDGRLDVTQCTKRNCSNEAIKTRRDDQTTDTCETKHWYYLTQCQICYCVNRYKLVCNNNNNRRKVQIGKYNMNDCGESLLDNLLELAPTNKHNILRSHRIERKRGRSEKNDLDNANVKVTKIKLKKKSKHKVPKQRLSIKDKLDSSTEKEITAVAVSNESDKEFDNEYNKENLDSEIATNPRNYEITYNNNKNNPTSVEIPDSDSKIVFKVANTEKNGLTAALKIDLPYVLDRLLNLNIRKSMVSINTGNNCKPGSMTKIDTCNNCYCLINGKMLCTTKNCN